MEKKKNSLQNQKKNIFPRSNRISILMKKRPWNSKKSILKIVMRHTFPPSAPLEKISEKSTLYGFNFWWKNGRQKSKFLLFFSLISLVSVSMERRPWKSKTLYFFLAISVLSVFVSYYWGERRIFYLLLVSVIFPLVVFIFFEMILGLRFPPGIITNLYYY